MSDAGRLTSALRVSGLVRRVNAEGGHAMVLHKGDPTAGAIILILCVKASDIKVFERTLDEHGTYKWRQIGINLGDDAEKLDQFLEKRRRIDPDLWVLELDVAHPERFIDESFAGG